MKKLQTLISLFFTLTILSLLVFWYLLRTSHLDQVLAHLDTELENLTHLPVHIEGQLHFKFFPRPAFKIPHIEIGSKNMDSPYFVELDDLTLHLKLKPLLQKKIIFQKIEANAFQIQLHPVLSKPTPMISPVTRHELSTTHLLEVNEISLHEGTLENTSLKMPLRLTHIQLNALQVSFTVPFPLQFKAQAQYNLNAVQPTTSPVSFKGNLKLPIECVNDPNHCLKYIDINGQVHVEHIKIKQFEATAMNATLQNKANTFLLNPMTASLYHGEAYGDVSIDLNTHQLFLNQTATNLNGHLFFSDLFQTKALTGKLDLSLHAHMNFDLAEPLKTLTGNGSFNLKDGDVKQFNLNLVLELARAKIHKLLNPSAFPSSTPETPIMKNPRIYFGSTPFKLFSMQFSIQQNFLNSNGFIFQCEELQLRGEGHYNLNSKEVRSSMNAHLDTGDEQLNKIQTLMGGSFPLRVDGTVSKLNIIPDTEKMMPLMHALIVQKTIETPLRIIQEQLQGFFNPQPAGDSFNESN